MKKIILSALLVVSITAFAQEKFTIEGKVAELNAPSTIYLRYNYEDNNVVDSAVLENGKFKFKGEISAPVKANLSLRHTGIGRPVDGLQIYLSKGTIKIKSADSLKNATIDGGKLNKEMQSLDLALKPANDKWKALNQDYMALTAEQKKDTQINNVINQRAEAIRADMDNARKKFIQTNPTSLVSLDALNSFGGSMPEYGDVGPLFELLSSDVKNSSAGKKYAEKLEKMRLTAVGAIAPDFSQADTSGKMVSLSSLRGKYVLVDFWASWCKPCRAENPNVVKAYHTYKDKNFTVLGVSLDQPNAKEKWLKAIADDKLEWTHVSDLKFWSNAVAVQYGINAIPQNLLIAPDGKIIAKNIRGEELPKKLDEIMNNKIGKPGM